MRSDAFEVTGAQTVTVEETVIEDDDKAARKRAKQEAKLAKAEAKAARKGETKEERKARKAAEKEAKAAQKQAEAEEKAARKAAKKAGKDQPLPEDATMGEKWERYNQLRANVRRRRVAYGIIIVLAILVFLGTAWDIIFNGSDFKWYLLPAYVVLLVWGILLLISRRRHLLEVAELEAMHRTYLECERCNSVFQFGEIRFGDRKRVGFSCPVCGEESALPGPGATPVERVLPEANVIETTYACGNCSEQIVLGTFGSTPRESRFRACPHCGVRGQVGLA